MSTVERIIKEYGQIQSICSGRTTVKTKLLELNFHHGADGTPRSDITHIILKWLGNNTVAIVYCTHAELFVSQRRRVYDAERY